MEKVCFFIMFAYCSPVSVAVREVLSCEFCGFLAFFAINHNDVLVKIFLVNKQTGSWK